MVSVPQYLTPPDQVTVVLEDGQTVLDVMPHIPLDTLVTVLQQPTSAYQLLHDRTTYYVCTGHTCLPPTNELPYPNR